MSCRRNSFSPTRINQRVRISLSKALCTMAWFSGGVVALGMGPVQPEETLDRAGALPGGSQGSAPRRPFASSIMGPNAGLSARLAGVVWTLSTRPSSSLRAKALYPGVEGDPFFTHWALNDTSGACGVSSSARDPRSGVRHTAFHQRIAKPAGGRLVRNRRMQVKPAKQHEIQPHLQCPLQLRGAQPVNRTGGSQP